MGIFKRLEPRLDDAPLVRHRIERPNPTMLASNDTGSLPGVEINFFMEIHSNIIELICSIL